MTEELEDWKHLHFPVAPEPGSENRGEGEDGGNRGGEMGDRDQDGMEMEVEETSPTSNRD